LFSLNPREEELVLYIADKIDKSRFQYSDEIQDQPGVSVINGEDGIFLPSPRKSEKSAGEIIRQYILSHDYEAWFSWESDQIIPASALSKLAAIMEAGNYMMIGPNSWKREGPTPNAGLGCALVRRDALEKHGFLLEYYSDMPRSWYGGDEWFKKHILKDGGSYIEIFGVIDPIYHLKE